MNDVEEAIRRYHRAFRTRVDAAVRELEARPDGEPPPDATLVPLGEDIVRYIQANGTSLFPAVAPLIVADEAVMAPMLYDIRAIDGMIAQAEEVSLLMLGAADHHRRALEKRLERLTAQLEALIELHLQKLEDLYLPLLRELPPERRDAVLDRLAIEYGPVPEWPEVVPPGDLAGRRTDARAPLGSHPGREMLAQKEMTFDGNHGA